LGDHSRAWEGVGRVPLDEVRDGAGVDGPWAFEIKDEGRVVNVVGGTGVMRALGFVRNAFRRIWFLFGGVHTLAWKAFAGVSFLALEVGPHEGLLPRSAMRAAACFGL
jgi:hypothetical protein